MSAPADLHLDRLAKRYGDVVAVDSVSLAVPAGRYVVLLGPSGSGKTTLLAMIAGFVAPSAGQVMIGGINVTATPPARRPTATVFQDYALFPHMSVGANVAFGLTVRGLPRAERARRAGEALGLVGLDGFESRRVSELSGGQRQRVALARALVVEPSVFLLDEPLGALDLHLRRQVQDELKRLQRKTGRTFIHVTHDQEEAMALADEIVIVNRGRIEDCGAPQRLYARPASRFAATFMGDSTLIEGRVAEVNGEMVTVETPLGRFPVAGRAETGAAVTLGLRPEHVRRAGEASDAQAIGEATLAEVAFQGASVRARARHPAGPELLVRFPPAADLGEGSRVALAVRPADLMLLEKGSRDA